MKETPVLYAVISRLLEMEPVLNVRLAAAPQDAVNTYQYWFNAWTNSKS